MTATPHDDAALDEAAVVSIRAALAEAVTRLSAASARDEALARFVPARRMLGVFPRAAALVPLGRVWHLGVFLLDRDETLYASGPTTRAVPPGYPGHQSVSAEVRRDYRAAAYRGPFARGETVTFDATPLPLDVATLREASGPLFLHDGSARVRWTPTADTSIEFGAYLAERLALLLQPPEGA